MIRPAKFARSDPDDPSYPTDLSASEAAALIGVDVDQVGAASTVDFFIEGDGAYDSDSNTVSGADKTVEILARVADAEARGGGRIIVKGYLRTTAPIVISSPLITLEGVGTFQHPNGRMGAPGGIIYDHASAGHYAVSQAGESQGLNLVNFGVYTRRGAAGSVHAEGQIYIEGSCLKALDGAFGLPDVTDGTGLDTLPGISQVRVVNTHISGFNKGFKCSAGASSLSNCQILYNRWNVHMTEGTLYIDQNCVIQDPVEGDLDLDYCGKFSMRDTNLEYGYSFDAINFPPLMRIGHNPTYPGVKPNNVSVHDCFFAGNAEPLATAVIIERVDGLYFGPQMFVNCVGDLFHNLTDDPDARIYIGEPKIIVGSPYVGTVIDDFTGVVEDELDGRRMFWEGFRVGAEARSDTLNDILPDFAAVDENRALTICAGVPSWCDTTHSLLDQVQDVPSVGSTETSLCRAPINADTFLKSEDRVEFDYTVLLVGGATKTPRVRLKFDATASTTLFDSQVVPVTTSRVLRLRGLITRRATGSARVEVFADLPGKVPDKYPVEFDVTGLDFTAALVLELTGQAGGAGAANADVTCQRASAVFYPASRAAATTVYHQQGEYWDFAESPGAKTGSVYGTVLTNAGNVFTAQGLVGRAATGDGFVYLHAAGNNPHLQIGLGLSFALRARVRPDSVAGAGPVMGKWKGDAGAGEEYLILRQGSKVRFYWSDGTVRFLESTTNLVAGTSYDLIGGYDSVTKTARLYVDGALEASHVGSNGARAANTDLELFTYNEQSGGVFIGLIEEPIIYKKWLTAAEIARLASTTRGPLYPLTAVAGNGTVTFADAEGSPGAHGGATLELIAEEEITLSTSGATTDSVANLLPAGAVIRAVTARVTQTITTATDWSLGDPTTATRFSSAEATLVAGTTKVGLNHQKGGVATDAAGPTQAAADKVRVTTTGTPGAGKIRVCVHYLTFQPPTS